MTNNDLKFNQIRVWRSKSRLVKRKADTARWVITAGVLLCNLAALAQQEGLQQRALKKFSQDPALKFAGWSLVVQEAGTGRVLVDRQGNLGLPAASTQKIFTSMAGFDLLGQTFRYETNVRTIGNSSKGDIECSGSGDPSFGSFRFSDGKPLQLLAAIATALGKVGINRVGDISVRASSWNDGIPDGWIWQDMGNYYGAGAYQFNWRENQFDVVLNSGTQMGSAVSISKTDPVLTDVVLTSAVTAAAPGSGDNSFIYLPPGAKAGIIKGTIPVNEKSFSIAGALPDPAKQFAFELKNFLQQNQTATENKSNLTPGTLIWKQESAPYDSLNYRFLRKSINLYGEAFLKTMGEKTRQEGSTEAGVATLKAFWQERGIDSNALQIIDGSGLSPQNRITANALVAALQYAAKQPWYPSFYQALPTYNGMKLKSGSIGGSRAFAGYHEAANGKKYVIAIIVNNYSCSSKQVVQKIFALLDAWK